jgi:hypothetical protein
MDFADLDGFITELFVFDQRFADLDCFFLKILGLASCL